ncbi:3-phosphoshikimate 1-carboxyvinyltransferase [Bacteroides sp. 224]|uniref:3-phosphoshikimate 1-carboxyvinyltransferase n=1 Tax=Bacteroides sp. 224 TaxID=2302936 RepID=UPI0013D3CB32|nr:3-phosphoshikimate 1-carboxyvinyltransferase [Bacteroides sp. 224]NDV65540.1 3-phosphoshikimate 1-carboxyvinyltransferase [Bacteroides sp. 224]
MQYKLSIPSALKANIQLPASKSISNRVLIMNALASGEYIPQNLSDCDDTNVMLKALSGNNEVVDIMAAGTAMRFLTAYFSITPGCRIITGTERMKNRPIAILVDALRKLGAQIEYVEKEGFPPLKITGKELDSNELALQGNVSSQYISALLLIAPMLKNGLNLFLEGEVISRPYINLTIKLMKDFGADLSWTSENSLHIKPRPYQSIPFVVESDWSAASYWYQLVALSNDAEIELLGLFKNSYQGDSQGTKIFERLGVDTEFTDRGVILRKSKIKVNRIEEDLVEMPDLAQTFVVTCALLNIPFHFTGLQTLKIKETDRITALITELGKLGFQIRQENDSVLIWDGEKMVGEEKPIIHTYEDHRMAMAFAPAAIHFPNLRIAEPQVVTKSYPDFWKDLQKAGVLVKEL